MERYGRADISEMDDRFALLIDADNVSAKYIQSFANIKIEDDGEQNRAIYTR